MRWFHGPLRDPRPTPYLEAVFWVPGASEMGTGEMATKKVPLGSKDRVRSTVQVLVMDGMLHDSASNVARLYSTG